MSMRQARRKKAHANCFRVLIASVDTLCATVDAALARLDEHYHDDRDEPFDEPTCERCNDDGMDPWCDYLLPCPACQSERR